MAKIYTVVFDANGNLAPGQNVCLGTANQGTDNVDMVKCYVPAAFFGSLTQQQILAAYTAQLWVKRPNDDQIDGIVYPVAGSLVDGIYELQLSGDYTGYYMAKFTLNKYAVWYVGNVYLTFASLEAVTGDDPDTVEVETTYFNTTTCEQCYIKVRSASYQETDLPDDEADTVNDIYNYMAANMAGKANANLLGNYASIALLATALRASSAPSDGLFLRGKLTDSTLGVTNSPYLASWDTANSKGYVFVAHHVYTVDTNGTATDYTKAFIDRITAVEGEIDDLLDGTTIAMKAYKDEDGNNIKATYETKADATSKANADDGRLDALETFKDTTVPAIYETKVDATSKKNAVDAYTVATLLISANPTPAQLTAVLNEATTLLKGVMSTTDKTHLDTLYALLSTGDGNNVTDTIAEVLAIFATYPEGADIVTALAAKVDKTQTINAKPLSGNITLDKTDIGLPNVDNTSDANKPVSTAQAAVNATKADKLYAINLILNGNMETDTNGDGLADNWAIQGSATTSLANGEQSFTASAQYAQLKQTFSIISGHIYIVKFDLYRTANLIYASVYDGAGGTIQTVYPEQSSGWKTMYIYGTSAHTSSSAKFYIENGSASGLVECKLRNVVLIDITASVGAGNEYPKEVMATILYSQFTNSYFSGTVELSRPDYLLSKKSSTLINPLFGKRIAFAGDSITAGLPTSGNPYVSFGETIARNNSMVYFNYGIGGSTLAETAYSPFVGTSAQRTAGTARYQAMNSSLNYLVLWFGWNDIAYSTLGDIESVDATTFFGAYNIIVPYLINKYPLAKIVLIVTYYSSSAGDTFKQATRDIAKKYGLPYFDMDADQSPLVHYRAGVDATTITARNTTYTYDGTHLNQDGHNLVANAIQQFIKG